MASTKNSFPKHSFVPASATSTSVVVGSNSTQPSSVPALPAFPPAPALPSVPPTPPLPESAPSTGVTSSPAAALADQSEPLPVFDPDLYDDYVQNCCSHTLNQSNKFCTSMQTCQQTPGIVFKCPDFPETCQKPSKHQGLFHTMGSCRKPRGAGRKSAAFDVECGKVNPQTGNPCCVEVTVVHVLKTCFCILKDRNDRDYMYCPGEEDGTCPFGHEQKDLRRAVYERSVVEGQVNAKKFR